MKRYMPYRPRRKYTHDVSKPGIITAYMNGDSLKTICEKFNCGPNVIYTSLRSYGIPTRQKVNDRFKENRKNE